MLSGSRQHDTARPQVANGRDGLQMWRVAVNILNKQSRTADKGRSSSLGAGRGAKNSHRKTSYFLRNIGRGKKGAQGFSGEARRKETIQKTKP
jgi:hypothetical protein